MSKVSYTAFLLLYILNLRADKHKTPTLCYISCDKSLVFYGASITCNSECTPTNKTLEFRQTPLYDEKHIKTKINDKVFEILTPRSYIDNTYNTSLLANPTTLNILRVTAYSPSLDTDFATSFDSGDLLQEGDGTIIMNDFRVTAVNEVMRRYLSKKTSSSGDMALTTLSSTPNLYVMKFKVDSRSKAYFNDENFSYFYKTISKRGRFKVFYSLFVDSDDSLDYKFTIESDDVCGIDNNNLNSFNSSDLGSTGFVNYTPTLQLPAKFKLKDKIFDQRNLCSSSRGCKSEIDIDSASAVCVMVKNKRIFKDFDGYLVMQFVPIFDIESKETSKIYYEISSWFPWRYFFIGVFGVLLIIMVGALITK